MADDAFKPLLMGYLDEELTELEAFRMEQHLKECPGCHAELQDFRRLKEATNSMRVSTPDERYWDKYWSVVYNRLERRIGWIFLSLGTILLTSYGLYYLVSRYVLQGDVPIIVRAGIIALVIGLCTLLVSVLRERMFLFRKDKYERIKR